MQALKDTFYLMLRDRVAAANAARTIVIRGAVRPAVVVVENELPGASVEGLSLVETFCMRWTGLRIDPRAGLPLKTATCEIRYATDGSSGSGGMDRGRALAAMDAELAAALSRTHGSVPKLKVNGVADGTKVFWGEVAFEPAVMRMERMERTAKVEVFCYGE